MSYASSEGSSLLPPVVFPNAISVDTISPISPSTVVEFTGSGGIDANQFVGASVISTTETGTIQCGSLSANGDISCDSLVDVSVISTTETGTIDCGSAVVNTSITVPTINVNTISPGAGQLFTQIISGEVDTALYGSGGNSFVIAVNSQATPFPASGTEIIFETCTNTSTVVNPLSLTTTTVNVNLPIVPAYTYPITNTSAIGYNTSTYVATLTLTAATNTILTSITIPHGGLWLLTGQCDMTTGNNVLSINLGVNAINLACATFSTSGYQQCTGVFTLTSGTVMNLIGNEGTGGVMTSIYLTATRLA